MQFRTYYSYKIIFSQSLVQFYKNEIIFDKMRIFQVHLKILMRYMRKKFMRKNFYSLTTHLENKITTDTLCSPNVNH